MIVHFVKRKTGEIVFSAPKRVVDESAAFMLVTMAVLRELSKINWADELGVASRDFIL